MTLSILKKYVKNILKRALIYMFYADYQLVGFINPYLLKYKFINYADI
jgi:hypothetical protein